MLEDRHGLRARALIVVLWPAALRIQQAPPLSETDLDSNRCAVLVQHGKGGHGREVGIDMRAWNAQRLRLTERAKLQVRPMFCVIDGPTRGVRACQAPRCVASFTGSPSMPVSAAALRHISFGLRTLLSSPATDAAPMTTRAIESTQQAR